MTVIEMTDFDSFYSQIYGTRWVELKEALLRPRDPVTLRCGYLLDPASLLPVKALDPKPGMSILDLCAAPGGKTLAICEMVDPNSIELHANEVSKDRFHRMRSVFNEFLGKERTSQIQMHCQKGELLFRKFSKKFDRILVDAPCSSERHLLEDPKEFSKWTPKRSKALAMRQYALLSSAWLMLKPGGIMVYSTCALTPIENSKCIEKFLNKKKQSACLLHFKDALIEPLSFGGIALPDRHGYGPIFLTVIFKKEDEYFHET